MSYYFSYNDLIDVSYEQLPSLEKQLLWKLQVRTSRSKIFHKTVFWKFLKISHNGTYARVSFSIKLQAIVRERLFYGISLDDGFYQISFRRTIQKIFEKFPRKHPWKSLILIMMETLGL